jgi:hypothetical protein
MSTGYKFSRVQSVGMAVNHNRTPSEPHANPESHAPLYADGDRQCRSCREVALAFDPAAERARCLSCGELT